MSCSVPVAVFAHGSEPAPLAERWTLNWWLFAAFALSVWLYRRGYRALTRRRGKAWPRGRRQALCFALAWIVLLIALVSPLDFLSDALFSAHMVQHELLMLVAAPLFVWARPLELYAWALPEHARGRVLGMAQTLTHPASALLLHGAVRWIWHVPVFFEAALAHEWVHGVQHASFFATAVLFWWTVMQGRYGRLGYGVSTVFVFATMMHTGALGALITFAQRVWYPTYATRAPDALGDQQLGGLIMWVVAGAVGMLIGTALFAAWLLASQRAGRLREIAEARRS